MNKTAVLKSTLISAMLVAMVIAFIPAASATVYSDTKTASGSYGEGVGAGVSGDKSGSYYYSCSWHSGVWTASGVTRYSLSWTFYGNGNQLETGTTFADPSHDRTASGPYSSMGASATGAFRYNGGTPYYMSTSRAQI